MANLQVEGIRMSCSLQELGLTLGWGMEQPREDSTQVQRKVFGVKTVF